MVFFFVYIFSVLILGAFNIGPYSIRVYMTVSMLLYLLMHFFLRRKVTSNKMPRRFIILFCIFVFFAGVGLKMNGGFAFLDYPKLFLANYLNSIVTFFAIDYFVTDEYKLRKTIIFLSILIGFDAIVTLLQHYGNPLGQLIALAFTTSKDYANALVDNLGDTEESLFGLSAPVGLMGYIHTNAIYLVCFGLYPICLSINKSKIFNNVFWWLITVLCLYSCFCTQERTAFLLFLLLAFYFAFKQSNGKVRITLLAVVCIFVVMILPSMLLDGSLGRFSSFSAKEDSRATLWTTAISFISQNFLLGGPAAFNRMSDVGAHNYFLNALINFGLIPAIIAFYMYFDMIKESLSSFFRTSNITIRVMAGSALIYLINSLFHNASILTGDTQIFLIYPLLIKACSIYGISIIRNTHLSSKLPSQSGVHKVGLPVV